MVGLGRNPTRLQFEAAYKKYCKKKTPTWINEFETLLLRQQEDAKTRAKIRREKEKAEDAAYWQKEFEFLKIGCPVHFKITSKSDMQYGFLQEIISKKDFVVTLVDAQPTFKKSAEGFPTHIVDFGMRLDTVRIHVRHFIARIEMREGMHDMKIVL